MRVSQRSSLQNTAICVLGCRVDMNNGLQCGQISYMCSVSGCLIYMPLLPVSCEGTINTST